MNDEKLRGDVLRAFGTAREVYGELAGETNRPIAIASRVATDDEIRDKLRDAIEDLRSVSDRLQAPARSARRPEVRAVDRGPRARHPLQPGHRADTAASSAT
jgi:hypothetical protein